MNFVAVFFDGLYNNRCFFFSRYISRLEGVDSGVKQRLSAHLHRCVTSLQQMPPPNPPPNLHDDNNNSSQRTLLIPSRLPTGELALVVPKYNYPSSQPPSTNGSAFKPPENSRFQPFQVEIPNSHLTAHISIPDPFEGKSPGRPMHSPKLVERLTVKMEPPLRYSPFERYSHPESTVSPKPKRDIPNRYSPFENVQQKPDTTSAEMGPQDSRRSPNTLVPSTTHQRPIDLTDRPMNSQHRPADNNADSLLLSHLRSTERGLRRSADSLYQRPGESLNLHPRPRSLDSIHSLPRPADSTNLHQHARQVNSPEGDLHHHSRQVNSPNGNLHPHPRQVNSPNGNLHPHPRQVNSPNGNVHPHPRQVNSPNEILFSHPRQVNSDGNLHSHPRQVNSTNVNLPPPPRQVNSPDGLHSHPRLVNSPSGNLHSHHRMVNSSSGNLHSHPRLLNSPDGNLHQHSRLVNSSSGNLHSHPRLVNSPDGNLHQHSRLVNSPDGNLHPHSRQVNSPNGNLHSHSRQVNSPDGNLHPHSRQLTSPDPQKPLESKDRILQSRLRPMDSDQVPQQDVSILSIQQKPNPNLKLNPKMPSPLKYVRHPDIVRRSSDLVEPPFKTMRNEDGDRRSVIVRETVNPPPRENAPNPQPQRDNMWRPW